MSFLVEYNSTTNEPIDFDISSLGPLVNVIKNGKTYNNFKKNLYVKYTNCAPIKFQKHHEYGISIIIDDEELMTFLHNIEIQFNTTTSILKTDYPTNVRVKVNKGLSLFKNTDGEHVDIYQLETFPTQISNAIVLFKVVFYKTGNNTGITLVLDQMKFLDTLCFEKVREFEL